MTDLLNLLANIKKEAGQDAASVENSLAEAKALREKRLTNDTENTQATWRGKELVPQNNLIAQVMTMPGREASFIKALPWFHGYNMGISETLPIKGILPRAKGNSEWTTWAGAIDEGKKRIATDSITITQKPLIIQVDISKRFINYSIDDLMTYVTSEMGRAIDADTEFAILNADSTDDATWNINCVDAKPSTTFTDGANDLSLQFDTSIRKYMLDNSLTISVWTLEWSHFIAVRQKLGKYAIKLNDLMLLMDSVCYHKALTLDEFKKANENGRSSTIFEWAISNIAWVDLYLPESFQATTSDWTISATAANNTKGWFIYLYKPAVQFWFGQDMEIEVYNIPGKGKSIIWTYEFGFNIVNQKAWETDNRIYGWINVTGLSVSWS
mgnify:CR=1 FL=1